MAYVIDRLQQPEYTGENRCRPCTVVNLIIGVALAAATFALATVLEASAFAVPLAAAVLGISVLLIYFRGYLVPGTPTVTKRYFPPWLLRLFGKPADAGVGNSTQSAPETSDDLDPEALLTAAGALEPCADADDLCLTDSFGEEWHDAIAETSESGNERERLQEMLGTEDLDMTFGEQMNSFWVRASGRRVGSWESRAAFIADVTAAPLLAERLGEWEDLSMRNRGRLLSGLRLFLKICPKCESSLELNTETVDSCCSSHEVAAVSCDACGARLFESDPL